MSAGWGLLGLVIIVMWAIGYGRYTVTVSRKGGRS